MKLLPTQQEAHQENERAKAVTSIELCLLTLVSYILYTSISTHTSLHDIMANTFPVTQAPDAIFTSAGSTLSPETSIGGSDLFEFNDWIHDNDPAFFPFTEEYGHLENPVFASGDTVVDSTGISISSKFHDDGIIEGDCGRGKEKEIRDKVAFRTKSQIEILDDGFKWRKYGKKMVKNSPNPRNYFKCSVEGCSVKKRVERDKDDPHYVVTTYEGIHNHQGPYL